MGSEVAVIRFRSRGRYANIIKPVLAGFVNVNVTAIQRFTASPVCPLAGLFKAAMEFVGPNVLCPTSDAGRY